MVEASVYVFDPTFVDTQSKVRGVGRYIDSLMEALGASGRRISDLSAVPPGAVLVNPFFNLLSPPFITRRITPHQVAVIHDMIPFKYPKEFPIGIRGNLTVWRTKKTLSLYDKIITDSVASKKDIKRILRLQDNIIHVAYPSIASLFNSNIPPVASTAVAALVRNNPRYFIYVGDATWNKNLVNIAKALEIVKVPCIFVGKAFTAPVTGNPWQEELAEFLDMAKNNPLFLFPGYVSNDDLVFLYRHAVANVLVSRDEGFGFSYLEAGSQQCPSVLADVPIFREISEGRALFVNPEDPVDIAKKMEQFAKTETDRAGFGLQAFDQSRLFSTKQFRTRILSLLLLD